MSLRYDLSADILTFFDSELLVYNLITDLLLHLQLSSLKYDLSTDILTFFDSELHMQNLSTDILCS